MADNWLYSDIVKDHFRNPRNILWGDEKIDADGEGTVGNIKCGDEMTVYIKVDKENEKITDCKWKTYGCASAIASTSVMSEMVKGMKVDEAYKLSPKDIAKGLGGLPEHKIHCSVLGDKALRAAIRDYYKREGKLDRLKEEEKRVVCNCMNVTEKEIEDAVKEGVRTFYELQEHTKIGTVCGKCKPEANRLLQMYIKKYTTTPHTTTST